MHLRLTDIPRKWNGDFLGINNRAGESGDPRDLRSFIVQALCEAQLAVQIEGQPGQNMPLSPQALLERYRLASRVGKPHGQVELSPVEFSLIEICVASSWPQSITVRLIGALHDAVDLMVPDEVEPG